MSKTKKFDVKVSQNGQLVRPCEATLICGRLNTVCFELWYKVKAKMSARLSANSIDLLSRLFCDITAGLPRAVRDVARSVYPCSCTLVGISPKATHPRSDLLPTGRLWLSGASSFSGHLELPVCVAQGTCTACP